MRLPGATRDLELNDPQVFPDVAALFIRSTRSQRKASSSKAGKKACAFNQQMSTFRDELQGAVGDQQHYTVRCLYTELFDPRVAGTLQITRASSVDPD